MGGATGSPGLGAVWRRSTAWVWGEGMGLGVGLQEVWEECVWCKAGWAGRKETEGVDRDVCMRWWWALCDEAWGQEV